ncbi:glycoside hydrolase superfamily [Lipomyces oligophaga]|uniref:glycoside hydrolase superfamily n=1 Tax=Lipomyces oligophaga TaxID=45792 RepID=UPI0034CE6128
MEFNTMSKYKSVLYFCNWAIYARHHFVTDLPLDQVTHILYAFANIDSDTGSVILSDLYADKEIHFEGDSWNDTGTNVYGNFKQLMVAKVANRNLKVLLSIGGWTYSHNFAPMACSPAKRAEFVRSAMNLIKDLCLDGLDIDWEYPATAEEAGQFVLLLREIREAMDCYQVELQNRGVSGVRFYLTIATPCGPHNLNMLDIPAMDRCLDFWNMMAYDFSGPAFANVNVCGHQANIYGGSVNANAAITYVQSRGVSADKIVLGMPLYGRSFANTDGLGRSFQGAGNTGSWENGVFDYKALSPHALIDHQAIAAYSFDSQERKFVTYESLESARLKAGYIKQRGLGGAMWWESSSDRPTSDPDSIVAEVVSNLGGIDKLVHENNWIHPIDSVFDNFRRL